MVVSTLGAMVSMMQTQMLQYEIEHKQKMKNDCE